MKRQHGTTTTIATGERQGSENKHYDNLMLLGLQQQTHIYAGTVPNSVKLERRRKNKVRRATRIAQRRAARNGAHK